jgi:AcrR family transcriptional regulator
MPTVSADPPQLQELPVVAAEAFERADAARNRRRVLAAAERLFARDGVSCTSMDAIASEAGVGKGTLFRRFGDRASLVRAVLGERERMFQEAFIRGPAPLGPGAPPGERLVAFGESMLDLLEEHGELMVAAKFLRPDVLPRGGPQAVYHLHLATLVRAAAPDLDADLAAETLLAGLDPQLFLHQRRAREVPLDALKRHWAAVARRLLGYSSVSPSSSSSSSST